MLFARYISPIRPSCQTRQGSPNTNNHKLRSSIFSNCTTSSHAQLSVYNVRHLEIFLLPQCLDSQMTFAGLRTVLEDLIQKLRFITYVVTEADLGTASILCSRSEERHVHTLLSGEKLTASDIPSKSSITTATFRKSENLTCTNPKDVIAARTVISSILFRAGPRLNTLRTPALDPIANKSSHLMTRLGRLREESLEDGAIWYVFLIARPINMEAGSGTFLIPRCVVKAKNFNLAENVAAGIAGKFTRNGEGTTIWGGDISSVLIRDRS